MRKLSVICYNNTTYIHIRDYTTKTTLRTLLKFTGKIAVHYLFIFYPSFFCPSTFHPLYTSGNLLDSVLHHRTATNRKVKIKVNEKCDVSIRTL